MLVDGIVTFSRDLHPAGLVLLFASLRLYPNTSFHITQAHEHMHITRHPANCMHTLVPTPPFQASLGGLPISPALNYTLCGDRGREQ
ncbi:unnamed protein product [Protopolystoma xenopodis]|uniref:Uncharacterized protein n=1 Tax=Protopolystoma xenopodis TaxID=117903 RepID=A0A3S5A028_9PLAT|nr:unnamed protein product [Protopolystoma xenopodis]